MQFVHAFLLTLIHLGPELWVPKCLTSGFPEIHFHSNLWSTEIVVLNWAFPTDRKSSFRLFPAGQHRIPLT